MAETLLASQAATVVDIDPLTIKMRHEVNADTLAVLRQGFREDPVEPPTPHASEARVLNLRGNLIGSCSQSVARHLLGGGQASLENFDPFTIRLRRGASAYWQEVAPKPRPPHNPSLGPTLREHVKNSKPLKKSTARLLTSLKDSDLPDIVSRLSSGDSVERVAAYFGMSRGTLKSYLDRHGVLLDGVHFFPSLRAHQKMRKQGETRKSPDSAAGRSTSLSASDLFEALKQLHSGQSVEQVASRFAVSPRTLRKYFREKKILSKPPGCASA